MCFIGCMRLIVVFLLCFLSLPASAMTLIRDAEIEAAIYLMAEDVMLAAGQNPSRIDLYLVSDEAVNAFVTSGNRMFITTGLLLEADKPEEVIGVIAHELGHIAAGHLARMGEEVNRITTASAITSLLGIGALLAGAGPAGAALIYGGQAQGVNQFLSFSRIQENAADQAAIRTMEAAGLSPYGLSSFMQKLSDQELLPASQQDAYLRTHPLTRTRIETTRAAAETSRHPDRLNDAAVNEAFARMQAKLHAFLRPAFIARIYSDADDSIAAQYARTIADYRQNRFEEAIDGIDTLIKKEPKNPWFHELKGQILRDFNRLQAALSSYERAVRLAPDAGLIRIAIAHALTQQPRPSEAQLNEAQRHLTLAQKSEKRDARIYRLLAGIAGRRGRESEAQLYLAEEALLRRDGGTALAYARRVQAAEKPGSRLHLRASDIINFVEN